MSLSRWAARTRGVSAAAASFRARTPGTATSAATSEQEGKKSPQNGAWHRCKDSISGGSPLLPANGSTRHPGFPCADLSPSSSPCSQRLLAAPSAFGSSSAHATTVDLRDRRDSVSRRPAPCRGSRLPGSRGAAAGEVELRTRSTRRPLERLATCGARGRGRPGRRIAGAAARRLAPRQPVVGRAVGSPRGARGRERHASPRAARVEPRGSHSAPRPERDR